MYKNFAVSKKQFKHHKGVVKEKRFIKVFQFSVSAKTKQSILLQIFSAATLGEYTKERKLFQPKNVSSKCYQTMNDAKKTQKTENNNRKAQKRKTTQHVATCKNVQWEPVLQRTFIVTKVFIKYTGIASILMISFSIRYFAYSVISEPYKGGCFYKNESRIFLSIK